jgi:hypothetical protein
MGLVKIKFMKTAGRLLVRLVEYIRKITGLYTYQIEFILVGTLLVLVVVLKGFSWVEMIGAGAVFFTFAHAKVANRLSEREEYRNKKGRDDKTILPYYFKIKRYFYLKEVLWFAYFSLLGAWSALVGTVIFLLYQPWRNLWRQYHPLSEKHK